VTLIALVLLAVVALAPLFWSLRHGASPRGRREAALARHRAHLAEVDRDLEEGRIGATDHATAKLEIQRRLLAEAEAAEPAVAGGGKALITAALIVVPVVSFGLYILNGHPELPAMPLASRPDAGDSRAVEMGTLIAALREKIAQLDPNSDQARQGYVLLGNVEDSRGNLAEAVQAWQTAMNIRFDPTLAAQTAEARTQLDGRVTPEAAELFRKALADAPQDAPWRPLAEKRLAEAK
jgi:cytochrome c-type biogenesis protein CcmH